MKTPSQSVGLNGLSYYLFCLKLYVCDVFSMTYILWIFLASILLLPEGVSQNLFLKKGRIEDQTRI